VTRTFRMMSAAATCWPKAAGRQSRRHVLSPDRWLDETTQQFRRRKADPDEAPVLPEDVLRIIMGLLCFQTRMVAARVCGRWRRACIGAAPAPTMSFVWAADEGALGSKRLSGAKLKAIASVHTDFLRIFLRGCGMLEDTAIRQVLCCSSRMVILDLGGCTHLTDATITTVAAACPKLACVALDGCPNLTSKAVAALARPSLLQLDIAECGDMDTAAVMTLLAANCPRLSHFDGPLTTPVPGNLFRAFMAACPCIEHLNLGTAALTRVFVAH